MRQRTRLAALARLAFPPAVVPSLVLLATLAAGGCNRFELLNATVPACGYTRTADRPYGPLSRQKLDVYRPDGAPPRAPVVVFIYGGSWQSGEKADYRFAAQALTRRGFVAVVPDYRLYPSVRFPAFVEDAALAVRWVHDHAAEIGGNPDRVYLMGHSAGAHIVALLALDGRYLEALGLDRRRAVRAAAALSGPYDFVPGPGVAAVFGMTPGGTAPPDPRIEPITYAGAGGGPPLLLLHGLSDKTVDAGNAARLADRVRRAGGDVRYIAYEGVDHVGVVLALAPLFRWIAPVLDDVATFFRDHA